MTSAHEGTLDTLRPPALADCDTAIQVGARERVRGPDEELARGDLLGRHMVLERLGAGGMGVVYAAYDPELDRKIAVKLIRGLGEHDRAGAARLLREAKAMARLTHPNVITVHDVGVLASGEVFVAMEFVDGLTLRAWQQRETRSWREILAVYREAGRGLAAAHAVGLVHRDFKPKYRRLSQTAPQPTDRPHSHSQGRFERVDVDRAAPGRPGVPHVLAKRWQRAGPPEDQRGHGPRNTCWCVVGPLPIMTDAVQRFTSAVPRRKPCGQ